MFVFCCHSWKLNKLAAIFSPLALVGVPLSIVKVHLSFVAWQPVETLKAKACQKCCYLFVYSQSVLVPREFPWKQSETQAEEILKIRFRENRKQQRPYPRGKLRDLAALVEAPIACDASWWPEGNAVSRVAAPRPVPLLVGAPGSG